MSPDHLVQKMKRRDFAPAYLFLGAESYGRSRCRRVLIDTMLPGDEREEGLSQYDLNEVSIVEVVDDARSLSLFTTRRVIVVRNAEAALPRPKAEEDEDSPVSGGGVESLEQYIKDPTPDVVLLFEAVRFDSEGEEKKKLDRVRKFYSCIADTVELKRHSMEEARSEAQALARQAGIDIDRLALDLLVEALGNDVARIAVEIEKLSLYIGAARTVTLDDIANLVPDARATTIFALVNALGRRDRTRSLQILETLCRDGEYLPLALSFLSTQFRMALASKDAGLRGPQQIQSHFIKAGIQIWGSRADQVYQTVSKFSKDQLERGLQLMFEADRDMKSIRPDDRIVMENFILALTKS